MASQPIYQLYAELCDYEPKMWRRFQILNNITVARLGYIIMTMFEMQASHLFCFDVPVADNYNKHMGDHILYDKYGNVIDIFNGRPDLAKLRVELQDEFGTIGFEGSIMDAAETKIKHVINHEQDTMIFSYDYGDGWQITLTLERIFEDKALPGRELPRVLEGNGYGIIEDCGGPGGLEEIAKVFKKKKGSQYQEYCKWLNVEYLDLSVFDIDDMNFRLKKVPRIYADAYEYGLEPTKQSMNLLYRKYKKT